MIYLLFPFHLLLYSSKPLNDYYQLLSIEIPERGASTIMNKGTVISIFLMLILVSWIPTISSDEPIADNLDLNVTPGEQWNVSFHKGGTETALSVKQTFDGGFIVVGNSRSGVHDGDVWLIKTDTNGTELWNKTFGKINEGDRGQSVQQTIDGGFIIGGRTKSYGAGGEDVCLSSVLCISKKSSR